jgi:hypothetical protein
MRAVAVGFVAGVLASAPFHEFVLGQIHDYRRKLRTLV